MNLKLIFVFIIFESIVADESSIIRRSIYLPGSSHLRRNRISKIEEDLQTSSEKNYKAELDQLNQFLINLEQKISRIEKKLNLANSASLGLYPKNCAEIQERGTNVSGIYTIQPDLAPEPFLVVCNMDIKDGGWTYVLNRFNGNQDFYLGWDDYKNGFGNLADEFWLGLQNLYYLTGYQVNELLIELEDWDSVKKYAHYNLFSIGSEDEGYSLKVLGEYNGDAGNALYRHSAMKFTTKDRDQDRYAGANCADYRSGAWWYRNCGNCQLTGKYMRGNTVAEEEYKGMFWEGFHGSRYSLKKARMMVRPT